MYFDGFWISPGDPASGSNSFSASGEYVETSTPIFATSASTAFLGSVFCRRSFSLANRYVVRASRDATFPAKFRSSLLPAGVHRTTEPLRLSQHAVDAMRCSRLVLTKIVSASQRRKIRRSRRAADRNHPSVENGMISNGSGIGV